MKCPYCGWEESKVVDKRETDDKKSIRRRRECLKCGKRFTTFERVLNVDILVSKKDRRRESFDRSKLRNGIVKACEKRPVTAQQIDTIVDAVEAELRRSGTNEVASKKIGESIIKKLKKLDKVAYIRFASVYREFEDVDDFVKELKDLTEKFYGRQKTKTQKDNPKRYLSTR